MDIQFQLSDTQVDLFSSIGDLFAVSEVDADQAVEDFARAVEIAVEIEGKITKQADYHLWVAGSEVMKLAYAKKKGITANSNPELFEMDSIKSMWKRFTRRLEENYALVKPASPSVEGQKKAEQRTKAQQVMEELKAKPIAELQDEIAMLTAKATPENLKQATKLAKAIKEKNRDALKDRMAEIKELQKEVIQAVKDCLDESLLQEALDTLVQYQPEESTI
jgi:hydrogenase maturation factor HypE